MLLLQFFNFNGIYGILELEQRTLFLIGIYVFLLEKRVCV
ncbi:conserved hypothetical protein [Borreliella finlandensis]|uniref:Uncharacterized protein n=1 Tax=Borreliella finlandensis TaxID=498741 RepID=A0A826H204_9SPIR|nr:conserved hypothetical protein [Borreliella finlandensis]